MSLYLQATLKAVWYFRGQTPIVKRHPGRELTHFYGALNLATGQEVVMRTPIMNADVSALFLQKLLLTYPDRPILLFWDKAPWHHGAALQRLLADHPRLEILYFPTAAPDLNPQEHVWKATREAVSHNHQMSKLDQLAHAVEAHLTSTTFPCSLLDQHDYHRLSMLFS
ncbi:MAG: IS630 family transposase [Chloroflexi bacterium]|nr:MAG: IS630 family transposase [Chloroflexota bacterium]